jgi:4'-phosphopantetheinyl transferase
MRLLSPAAFSAARYPEALRDDEIQLWYFPADDGLGARRDEAWLRPLLAAHVGCAPERLVLRRGAHGKPYLDEPAAFEFNLSHSRGAALLGLSRRQPIGVDIETSRRERPVLELARRFFADSEADALAAIAASERQAAFLRLWSCKEAVVKADGRGIGFGLSRVAFTLDANGMPARLNVIDASAGAATQWQIVGLAPSKGHTGALAWRGTERPVRGFVAMAP